MDFGELPGEGFDVGGEAGSLYAEHIADLRLLKLSELFLPVETAASIEQEHGQRGLRFSDSVDLGTAEYGVRHLPLFKN